MAGNKKFFGRSRKVAPKFNIGVDEPVVETPVEEIPVVEEQPVVEGTSVEEDLLVKMRGLVDRDWSLAVSTDDELFSEREEKAVSKINADFRRFTAAFPYISNQRGARERFIAEYGDKFPDSDAAIAFHDELWSRTHDRGQNYGARFTELSSGFRDMTWGDFAVMDTFDAACMRVFGISEAYGYETFEDARRLLYSAQDAVRDEPGLSSQEFTLDSMSGYGDTLRFSNPKLSAKAHSSLVSLIGKDYSHRNGTENDVWVESALYGSGVLGDAQETRLLMKEHDAAYDVELLGRVYGLHPDNDFVVDGRVIGPAETDEDFVTLYGENFSSSEEALSFLHDFVQGTVPVDPMKPDGEQKPVWLDFVHNFRQMDFTKLADNPEMLNAYAQFDKCFGVSKAYGYHDFSEVFDMQTVARTLDKNSTFEHSLEGISSVKSFDGTPLGKDLLKYDGKPSEFAVMLQSLQNVDFAYRQSVQPNASDLRAFQTLRGDAPEITDDPEDAIHAYNFRNFANAVPENQSFVELQTALAREEAARKAQINAGLDDLMQMLETVADEASRHEAHEAEVDELPFGPRPAEAAAAERLSQAEIERLMGGAAFVSPEVDQPEAVSESDVPESDVPESDVPESDVPQPQGDQPEGSPQAGGQSDVPQPQGDQPEGSPQAGGQSDVPQPQGIPQEDDQLDGDVSDEELNNLLKREPSGGGQKPADELSEGDVLPEVVARLKQYSEARDRAYEDPSMTKFRDDVFSAAGADEKEQQRLDSERESRMQDKVSKKQQAYDAKFNAAYRATRSSKVTKKVLGGSGVEPKDDPRAEAKFRNKYERKVIKKNSFDPLNIGSKDEALLEGSKTQSDYLDGLMSDIKDAQYSYVTYSKEMARWANPTELRQQMDRRMKGYYHNMIDACLKPLEGGVDAGTVVETVGIWMGMCIASKPFRDYSKAGMTKAMWPAIEAKTRTVAAIKDALPKSCQRMCNWCERTTGHRLPFVADKIESHEFAGDKAEQKLKEKKAAMLKVLNNGRVPLTAETAALNYVAFSMQYYEQLRNLQYDDTIVGEGDSSAARAADAAAKREEKYAQDCADLRAKYDASCKTLYQLADMDGVDAVDLNTNIRVLVGSLSETHPDVRAAFKETAGFSLVKGKGEKKMIVDGFTGKAREGRVWNGEYYFTDEHGNPTDERYTSAFTVREPIGGSAMTSAVDRYMQSLFADVKDPSVIIKMSNSPLTDEVYEHFKTMIKADRTMLGVQDSYDDVCRQLATVLQTREERNEMLAAVGNGKLVNDATFTARTKELSEAEKKRFDEIKKADSSKSDDDARKEAQQKVREDKIAEIQAKLKPEDAVWRLGIWRASKKWFDEHPDEIVAFARDREMPDNIAQPDMRGFDDSEQPDVSDDELQMRRALEAEMLESAGMAAEDAVDVPVGPSRSTDDMTMHYGPVDGSPDGPNVV